MYSILTGIFYSFPIQLLVLHIKRNKLLLFFWVLLFGVVTNAFLSKLGGAYLFLDPEYLGEVSFWGFFWVGLAFGFFLITWNIATYMMNSFRFPFLGALHSPFYHFCINNSLIPLAFILTYFVCIFRFQLLFEFRPAITLFSFFGGFLLGGIFMTLLFALYFYLTNTNINKLLHAIKSIEKLQLSGSKTRFRTAGINTAYKRQQKQSKSQHEWTAVRYYLTQRLSIRRVRLTEHYSRQSLDAVFQQNHTNALVIQAVALCILIGLGFLMDKPAFQLPAAASVLLIFSVLMGLAGAFSFWLKGWRTVGFLVIILVINFFTRFDFFNYDTKAYGLNYHVPPATYNSKTITDMADTAIIHRDIQHTLHILDAWKQKNQPITPPGHQPDMILLNLSGGGLRAALWCMTVLQRLDSLMQGTLMDRTMLISGASGGMITGAYLHELFYLKKTTQPQIVLHNPQYAHDVSEDYLNAMIFSVAVNDLFYPFQTFETGGYTYRKNRAYMFEKQLARNSKGIINMDNRRISDYYQAEYQAQIPLLVFTPTIVTDRRKLFISSQPVAYLTRAHNRYLFTHDTFETDGVDCLRFFEQQDAHNLLLSTAVRLSATFPYILPSSFLPSSPSVEVMDAGFRDNTGFETSYRFLYTFKDWINQNTGKVIVINILSGEKDRGVKPVTESLIEKVVKPVTVFMTQEVQDNYADYMATVTDEVLQGRLQVITFEYAPSLISQKAALSLHLTTKEKNDIKNALNNPNNQNNVAELRRLLATDEKPDK